jgi:hypothetical protein
MALHNLLKNACIGDAKAQYELGIIYCIKADVLSAIYWLDCAKQKGNKKAIKLLKQVLHIHRQYLIKSVQLRELVATS